MRPSTTARRYAEAAFDVAREDGTVQAWVSTLARVAQAVQRPDVAGFFKEPNISREQKIRSASDMAQGGPEQVGNLLEMLAALNRIHLVPSILQEFRELDRSASGVVEASVTVARPLSDAEAIEIAQRLAQALGKKVELQAQVDPAILGGIVVRVGDRLIDASVKGRLDRLRNQLAS